MTIEEYSGILVYLEDERGAISKSSLGTLGKARYLAEILGVNVDGVIFGQNTEVLAKEAIAYGADKVHACPVRKEFSNGVKETASFNIKEILDVLYNLINELKPEIILFSNSIEEQNLTPRLAQRFEVGLGCNCTGLEIDTEKRTLLMTYPIYEGKMLKEVASTAKRPQIATISEATASVEPIKDDLREGEIVKL